MVYIKKYILPITILCTVFFIHGMDEADCEKIKISLSIDAKFIFAGYYEGDCHEVIATKDLLTGKITCCAHDWDDKLEQIVPIDIPNQQVITMLENKIREYEKTLEQK